MEEKAFLLSFSKRPRIKSHWLDLGPVSAAEPISRARVIQYSDWLRWGHVFPLKLKVLSIFKKKPLLSSEQRSDKITFEVLTGGL